LIEKVKIYHFKTQEQGRWGGGEEVRWGGGGGGEVGRWGGGEEASLLPLTPLCTFARLPFDLKR